MVTLPEVLPLPVYLETSWFKSTWLTKSDKFPGASLEAREGDKLIFSYRKPLRSFLPEPSQGLL